MESSAQNFPIRLVLGIGAAVALFVALGSLLLPEGPDQAMFTWIGRVVLDGGSPYKDAWDIKGPLTYYIYALALALFGRQELAIRIFDLLCIAGCCWLLASLVLRLTENDRLGACGAVVFFCLVYYAGGYADTAQPEEWGGMLILIAVRALLASSRKPYRQMLTVGVCIALAGLIKPTFFIYLLLPLLSVAFSKDKDARRFVPLLWAFAGFSIVLALEVINLLRSHALSDLIDVQRYLMTTYEPLGRTPLFRALLHIPEVLFELGMFIPYLLVPLALWYAVRLDANAARLLGTWFALANLTVIVQGRYWQDHWLPAAIATAVLSGLAITYIMRALSNRLRQPLVTGLLAALICAAVIAPPAARAVARNANWPLYAVHGIERSQYVNSVTRPFNEVTSPFNYTALEKLSDYLNRHSSPQDRLVVWGWDVSIFVMSERDSATRFGAFGELIETGPLRERFRNIFLREIQSRSPRYVIVDTKGAWYLQNGAGVDLLNDFPGFRQLIEKNYRLETQLDVYQIWIRTEDGSRYAKDDEHG